MIKKIQVLLSCDGIKGLMFNPEVFFLSSKYGLLKTLGGMIEEKKKQKRKEIISKSYKPLLTIVLPAFNSGKTLEKAIDSIKNQSYSHWELIVIDDASTDNSVDLVNTLSCLDQRIRLYQNNKNMGVAYSRNVGLYYSKGDYITFHDADDYSHYERLEYQLACILNEPAYKVIVPQYVRVDKAGVSYVINGRKKWNRVSGMLFPRKVIEDLGYFKPINISEDSEYYERILAFYGKHSRKIICKVLYYALFSPDSLLFSNASVQISNRSINYRINHSDYLELDELRETHKLIKMGKVSPYQSFRIDINVTKLN